MLVTTMVAEAGHEVTVGGQLVTVISWVEKTVEVVISTAMEEELVLAVATAARPAKRAAVEHFILGFVFGWVCLERMWIIQQRRRRCAKNV